MTLRFKTPVRAIALSAFAFFLAACSEDASLSAPPAPPPPQVSAVEVQPQSVPLSYQYAGRVSAYREVEVRARVSGILLERSYVEGAKVKAGDNLFKIDPTPYQAEVAMARGQLQEAQAQLSQAKRDAERAAALFARNVGTEKARDDAISAVELAEATVTSAKAQLETAQINLGYTTVNAPIDGITSLKVLPEGSLVGTGPNDSLLTSISQLDPAYVNFSFTDVEAAEIRLLMSTNQAQSAEPQELTVSLSFGDGQVYEHEGHVDFTSSSIDLQTGTIQARAIVPNPDSRLLPGQFVRVTVKGVSLPNAIVVPQAAVMQGPQGRFVYVVDSESKTSVRPVTLGREVDAGWIISDGLQAGDRVITEGVIKVHPGSPVSIAASAAPQSAETNQK